MRKDILDAMNRRNFIGAGSAAMMGLLLSKAGAQEIQNHAKANADSSASDPGPEDTGAYVTLLRRPGNSRSRGRIGLRSDQTLSLRSGQRLNSSG